MKCIIAGSRTITDHIHIASAILISGWINDITEVVCGMARDVDLLGKQWADALKIPVKEMPAIWREEVQGAYDPQAGYRRNIEMAKYADALIAVWDGQSDGTRHMIAVMRSLRKPVYIYVPDGSIPIDI